MKIVFVEYNIQNLIQDNGIPFGGACIKQYLLGKGLKEIGNEVVYMTYKGVMQDQIKYPINSIIESYDKNRGIKIIRWFYYRIPKIYFTLKKFNPDIVIQSGAGNLTGYISLICKVLNVSFIYYISSDADVDERIKYKLSFVERYMFKIGLKLSEKIICQNDYQYIMLIKKYKKKDVIVLNNPFELNKSELSQKMINDKKKYIAWIGNFRSAKNLNRLWEIIHDHAEYKFIIAGKMICKLNKANEDILRRLKSNSNVRFVGHLNRKGILKILLNANALLCTSDYEGFSNTFLEALSVGTPIISVSVDPDGLISKYNFGFMINENNASEVINKLFNNFDYWLFYKKAKLYLMRKHDYRAIANKFIDNVK